VKLPSRRENRKLAAAGPRSLLWKAFACSVRDNALAEFVVQVLRIGGVIVLARELLPADFGLLRVLLVASLFITVFCEAGIPDALIQRKELTGEHESTAWWLSVGLAALSATMLYLAAPAIEALMAMPGLGFGLRLLCIPLLLEGTAVTVNARLRRELRFGVLAAADVLGEVAFLLAAFLLLWTGHPRWSLAGGLGARFVAHALTIWSADARIPLGLPRLGAVRDMGRFALSVLGGRIVAVASGNADFILVGRLLGPGALGYYSITWDLLRFIPDRFYKVAGRVTFPAFCRLQDDNHELAGAYCDFVDYLARMVLPMAACIALAAPELVSTIYGPRWLPASVPLRLLAPGLALAGLRIGIGSVYYTKDHPSFDIYVHGARLALIVIAVWTLAGAGLFGVSAGVSAVEAAVSIAAQYMVCALVELKMADLFRATIPGLRVAGTCLMGCAVGKAIAVIADLQGPLALAVIALPAAIAFCWLEASDVAQMLDKAFGRRRAEAMEA
jgi:lipopolysaccharide exporter